MSRIILDGNFIKLVSDAGITDTRTGKWYSAVITTEENEKYYVEGKQND